MEKVFISVSRTEKGYSASCELLPGWVVAVTGDFDELEKEIQESVDFYVDCAKEDGETYPAVFDGAYTFEYKFDVRSLLYFYQNIFSFVALQHLTGINQKQLSHYAAGRSKPRKEQAQKIVAGLHRLAGELNRVSV
jgi:predicted RNase H-like HicB family nuclease